MPYEHKSVPLLTLVLHRLHLDESDD